MTYIRPVVETLRRLIPPQAFVSKQFLTESCSEVIDKDLMFVPGGVCVVSKDSNLVRHNSLSNVELSFLNKVACMLGRLLLLRLSRQTYFDRYLSADLAFDSRIRIVVVTRDVRIDW